MTDEEHGGDGEEWSGLDVPPLDLEYLEQWNLWHVDMEYDLSNLLEGLDEDDHIDDVVSAPATMEDDAFSVPVAKNNTQDAIPVINAMPGGQDTPIVINRHSKRGATDVLLDNTPTRKDSSESKSLKRKIPDTHGSSPIKKSKTASAMSMQPKEDLTCQNTPSSETNRHTGINKRHTTPQSLGKVKTDCNSKVAHHFDNVPGIRQAAALYKPSGCKMTDSHNIVTIRQAQAKPQGSYESMLEKAKEKLHDRYMKANQRRTTQLMDFRNLPKPAQGSCQRIYKSTAKKLNPTKKTVPIF